MLFNIQLLVDLWLKIMQYSKISFDFTVIDTNDASKCKL